jgi:hypothetical protein
MPVAPSYASLGWQCSPIRDGRFNDSVWHYSTASRIATGKAMPS